MTDSRLKLLYQTHSPYARKVLVMAHEAGLGGRLEVIHHETSPTNRNDEVFAKNPLGKVPVLIFEDGFALFDSPVICEYLDGLHGGRRLIPADRRKRLETLRLQAVAQGICDAGIALRWDTERRPQGLRWKALADGQAEKLLAAYDFFEREADLDGPVDLGQIALATALDWIAFRTLPDFLAGRPRLARWYRVFIERPSMRATTYAGETHD
jgi:Glutathione S-transferase